MTSYFWRFSRSYDKVCFFCFYCHTVAFDIPSSLSLPLLVVDAFDGHRPRLVLSVPSLTTQNLSDSHRRAAAMPSSHHGNCAALGDEVNVQISISIHKAMISWLNSNSMDLMLPYRKFQEEKRHSRNVFKVTNMTRNWYRGQKKILNAPPA